MTGCRCAPAKNVAAPHELITAETLSDSDTMTTAGKRGAAGELGEALGITLKRENALSKRSDRSGVGGGGGSVASASLLRTRTVRFCDLVKSTSSPSASVSVFFLSFTKGLETELSVSPIN